MNIQNLSIRKFLMENVEDEELTSLCFSYFHEVYIDFAQGMRKSQKVRMLLEYCQQRNQLDILLTTLIKERSNQENYELPSAQNPEEYILHDQPSQKRLAKQSGLIKNSFNLFNRYLRLDPPKLIGRERLLRQLLTGLTESEPVSHQIISFRTFGSSTILQYLAHPAGALAENHLRSFVRPPFEQPGQLIILYLDGNTYPKDQDFSNWLWDKMDQDKRLVNQPIRREKSAINAIKYTILTEIEKKRRIAILLDHFDHVLRNMTVDEATELRPLVGLGGFVTVTEKPLVEINADPAASLFGGQFNPINIEPLPDDDARHLVNSAFEDQDITTNNEERKEYLNLLKETGNYPYYILHGAAQWYELRKRYPKLPRSDLFKIWSNRLLNKGFYLDFSRFWRHIKTTERESLIKLVTAEDRLSINPYLFDSLMDVGLVEWNHNQLRPFSGLWEKFIKQKAQEREV